MMVDIERIPTRADAVIRVYKDRCVISSRACHILGLSATASRVRIRQDLDQLQRGGRVRIYISRSDTPVGYYVKRRGKIGQINSVALSRKLAEMLEGYGTYRICEEVYNLEKGEICYEIFFRKY